MNIETRIAIEKRIARQTIERMVEAGYFVKVYDGEEWACAETQDVNVALNAMMTTDEDRLYVFRKNEGDVQGAETFEKIGWVFFVYGNSGYDVVSDYTVNLEPQMAEIQKYADHQESLFA
jgi:hypothetical protein